MRTLGYLSLAKLVAFMAALVELVGSNSSDSSEASQATNTDKDLTKPLDSCSLIIVSTLDGKLSALDTRQNGALRWSLPAISGPLLSSSLSSLQNGKHVKIIPSLDGGLYQVNGDNIEPIPYTADHLLGSFYKLQDGSMLVGGKEAISCGIDPKSGKVKYVCSAEGCKLTDHETDEHVQDSDIFVVKRTKQTVRAVDQRTGSERWNFSVGQQDVTFLDSLINNQDTKCPMEDSEEAVEWKLRVSIPDGLIAAVKLEDMAEIGSDIVLWSHKFESPVNAVWMLHGSYLKAVDIFSEDVLPGLRDGLPEEGSEKPIMYLGSHEGQVYIQHSHHTLNPFLESAIKVQSKGNNEVARRARAISWKPKLATSASRTPTIVSKEIAIWNPVEYPFDNGYFFFGDVQPVVPPHERRIKNFDQTNETLNTTSKEKHPVDPPTSLMEYWKGAIFVIGFLSGIAHYIFRFLLPQTEKTPELHVQRLPPGSNMLTASSSEPTLQREQSMTSNSSSASMNSLFVSRYATDFEHELCLGKGGFGVVFQAKNKVDDCQYAIKRVRLPNCDEAREKVMREVKALAKLEHPCIVRYFNAWFEAPPVGWQEDIDKMYLGDRTCTDVGLDSEVNGHSSTTEDLNSSNMVVRRRKKTSSSTKSKHSLSDCSEDKDGRDGRRATLTAADEDLSVEFDVHQLENEAFLPEADTSGSFGVEFVDSSKSDSGVRVTSQQDVDDDNADSDDGIVFSSHTEGENLDVAPLTSKSSNSSASSKSLSPSFTTSGQSLLSGMHHKCKSEKCTQDTIQAPLYLFIQMQLCQRESLKDWLKINTKRDHASCLNVFDQIANAVEYFHGRGMMHRDLKPSNIFFSLDGSVKVGDFGLVTASVQEPSDNPAKGKNGFIDANHTGQVGTHLYMSPEQLEGKAYSYKVDVFSLGLIFFELFYTFSTEMERIKVMIEVKRKVMPEEFESQMALQTQLVKWMLSESPKSRPTASEIRASEIYSNMVKDIQQKSNVKALPE